MNNLKYLIAFIGLAVTSTVAAQGHLDIEQKWLCRSLFNPAATGNTNTLDLYGIAHEQWIGVEGAPSVQLLHGHYLFQNANLGIGFGIINESIGFYHTLDFKASFAYHVPLSDEFTLSLGLSPILSRTSRNDAEISFDYPDMALFAPPFESRTDVNFDAGMELRHQWFKLGISGLRLIEQEDNPVSYRSFMIYATNRFGLTERVDFSPVLAGTLHRSAINGEAGIMFYYKRPNSRQQLSRLNAREVYDFLWGGLFVRPSGDVSILAGVGINAQWRLGYAFKYSFQYRSEYSPSSHEIMLSWRIPTSNGTRYYKCEDC